MTINLKKVLALSTSLGVAVVCASGASAATTAQTQTHTRHRVKHTAPVSAPSAAPAATVVSKPAVRAAALSSGAASAFVAPRDESILVTGSALSQRADSNANPVQTITAKDIQSTSATTLGDYLLRLPSISASGTNNTNTNGGLGMSCSDIRNLGQNRVLVLVDGKRQVPTFGNGSQCVDMNSIPMDMVESVEILKDGGSELYGADAVAGVINIKLRHNTTKGNITIRGGITDKGDGQMGLLSGYKGFDFDHGRGNITVFGSYMTQSGIRQKNRDWSATPWNSDPAIGENAAVGSSIPMNTRVIDPSGNFDLVSNGTGGGANGFHNFSTSDRYNFASEQMLTNSLQQGVLAGDAHYELNEHVDFYSSVRYTHKDAMNTLAGNPMTGASYPSTLETSVVLPAGNPYNIWGQDVDLYKRFSDIGPRKYEEAFDTWQYIGGAKGRIVGDWHYDVSMTYGESLAKLSTENMENYAHYLDELGSQQVDPADPNSAVVYNPSICKSSAGCVLVNPFQAYSGQAANYLRYTQVDHSAYYMRDFNARVHNNRLAKLPWQGGGHLGVAMGLEHRSEQASYKPDPLAVNGDLGGGATYTGGGYDVTEAYIESNLLLLRNVPFAHDLTIDGQGRWSHYNTFGDAYNWKASINYAPISDIRFRATLGTSFRAPTLTELYSGHQIGYNSGNDPCAQASSYGSYSAAVVAKCASQGINTATFVNANSSQIPTLGGGNSALKPEEGRTYTFGTVITPRWIPNLTASVEYWHYTVKNTILQVPVQFIVDECYTGVGPSYCNLVSQRSSAGQLTQVNDTYENAGGLRTNGIDFDLSYRFRLTKHDSLMLNNNFQQIVGYLQQNEPGGTWYNYAGRLLYQNGYGFPRVRDYATATWSHDRFSLTYMMSYTGGMKFNDGSNDLSCKVYAYCKVPGVFSHDVTISYNLPDWQIELGVNNILDKKPPFVPDGASNTALSMYPEEIIGRYVFMQVGRIF
ncbi:TonB-dependent receptor plug domain-containing protein [Gluconacetobacter asukensis]|uniref:TonB-dependent receptor n=1 Tax=Gluconacetobacter asukensis TaxID=1017181 RepID=A0A7W4J2X1_9PROT|nr:TonB-dependent receptor [Gluconacetobacter asukensis]MBB2173614.1 TonB-dependent receptor [Gluconacetobacter asukensis]